MIKKILLWLSVICLSVTIFAFSAKPGKESTDISMKIAEKTADVAQKNIEVEQKDKKDSFEALHRAIRKGAHFAEFKLLAVLVYFLARSYNLTIKASIIISLGYCLLFAASDEIHQLFVDGRRGMARDVLLDFCGALTGVLICSIPAKLRKNKNKVQF